MVLARCKEHSTTLQGKGSSEEKWQVFAGIVADRWRTDRLSVTVAARPLPVLQFVPQRRRRQPPVRRLRSALMPLLNRHRQQPLPRRRQLRLLLLNPATLLSKFS